MRLLVTLAADFAEHTLPPIKDPRPALAIQAARDWVNGWAGMDSNAVRAAAHAASDFADDAGAAAYEAAHDLDEAYEADDEDTDAYAVTASNAAAIEAASNAAASTAYAAISGEAYINPPSTDLEGVPRVITQGPGADSYRFAACRRAADAADSAVASAYYASNHFLGSDKEEKEWQIARLIKRLLA